MAKKKKSEPALFAGGGAVSTDGELSAEEEEFVSRLGKLGFEGKAGDLLEHRFRRKHPDLHFECRSRFGNYGNALALLLKRELGSPLTRKQLLAHVKSLYATGEAVTLESLVVTDPRMANALLGEFGNLATAFEELGIDAVTAGTDRRWEAQRVFEEMLDIVGETPSSFSENELLAEAPLLSEVIRQTFGSFASFRKEFFHWVEEQPAVFVYWGRHQLSRMLLRSLTVTSRAAKGRGLPEVSRLRDCFVERADRTTCFLSTEGLLYPVQTNQVPFVQLTAGGGKTGFKLAQLQRGEKPVSFLSWAGSDGYLAIATRLGRLKLVDLASFKRIRTQGIIMIGLARGDQVAAAAIVPKDFARLVVVTRAGRAAGFERTNLKLSSRSSQGVIRLRFQSERNAEPVSVLGLAEGEDIVLLGKNGKLLRLEQGEVPVRKGASLGRRVWKTQVVSATGCPEQAKLLIATKKGRLLWFWDAQVPRRHAGRLGVMGIRLESDDSPEVIRST